ncbi:DUF6497 family protein [Roseicyclus marinus]|uniref:DUF6497 family protein n=1 Tax=Roseicyclus marinus TaxID=2161673 RepID=UPI00240FE1EB|nr:DUF6497 family protein [Roseicyclus marinus]MDG3041957.1 DUF6497 family protein [Roseicyclus marinus]
MLPALGLVGALALGPAAALADPWPLGEVMTPSGMAVMLEALVFEENPWSGESLAVVRLVAPSLERALSDPFALRADMDWACATWGQPAAASVSMTPDIVVVEMMAAPVERGAPDPAILQVFEQYRLVGPDCIWELF